MTGRIWGGKRRERVRNVAFFLVLVERDVLFIWGGFALPSTILSLWQPWRFGWSCCVVVGVCGWLGLVCRLVFGYYLVEDESLQRVVKCNVYQLLLGVDGK